MNISRQMTGYAWLCKKTYILEYEKLSQKRVKGILKINTMPKKEK